MRKQPTNNSGAFIKHLATDCTGITLWLNAVAILGLGASLYNLISIVPAIPTAIKWIPLLIIIVILLNITFMTCNIALMLVARRIKQLYSINTSYQFIKLYQAFVVCTLTWGILGLLQVIYLVTATLAY